MHSSLILNQRWGSIPVEAQHFNLATRVRKCTAPYPARFFYAYLRGCGAYVQGASLKAPQFAHQCSEVLSPRRPAYLNTMQFPVVHTYTGDYHATFPEILRRLRKHGGTAVHRPPEVRQRGAAPLSGADRQPSLHPQRRPDARPCLGIPRFAGLS